jgi:hypothetical protein
MGCCSEWINGEVGIAELVQKAPQVRPILERLGLPGGAESEALAVSLETFAQAHDVPLSELVRELRRAVESSHRSVSLPLTADWADSAYRPFFKAGILLTLSLGAVWGAWLLLKIAWGQTFRAVGIHEVNAHGHAQIFGWVGLFVMGFAYQAFPRFKQTQLAWPGVARLTLFLMVAGILGRSLLEYVAVADAALLGATAAASVLEVTAIVLFTAVILVTWRRSGKGLAFYDHYILSALGWFILQGVFDGVYTLATLAATERADLLGLVATWQGALRDMQVHGFATLMILGVSQYLFSHFYGLPMPRPQRSLSLLVVFNLAVVGEVAGLILMRRSGHAWAGLWYASVVLLAGGVIALLASWPIFGRVPESDRSLKFMRAAFVWLLVSLAMLVLLPVYQFLLLPRLAPASDAVQLGFSHAYSGAIRHAITVGFISLMIVGVAAKVVPVLNGVSVHRLSPLVVPFVLLNVGCALRVSMQVLTDVWPGVYPVAGVSGVLEVAGLALWGAHLWSVMAGRARLRGGSETGLELTGQGPIQAEHWVGDVIDRHPHLLDTFLAFGFQPLTNPLLRRRLAARLTIANACRLMGVDAAELLVALNGAEKPAREAGCGCRAGHSHDAETSTSTKHT